MILLLGSLQLFGCSDIVLKNAIEDLSLIFIWVGKLEALYHLDKYVFGSSSPTLQLDEFSRDALQMVVHCFCARCKRGNGQGAILTEDAIVPRGTQPHRNSERRARSGPAAQTSELSMSCFSYSAGRIKPIAEDVVFSRERHCGLPPSATAQH